MPIIYNIFSESNLLSVLILKKTYQVFVLILCSELRIVVLIMTFFTIKILNYNEYWIYLTFTLKKSMYSTLNHFRYYESKLKNSYILTGEN
jgi:hypothetical protein